MGSKGQDTRCREHGRNSEHLPRTCPVGRWRPRCEVLCGPARHPARHGRRRRRWLGFLRIGRWSLLSLKKNGKCFLWICGCEFSHLVVSIFSYTSISKLISTVWSRWFWSHSQKLDQLKQVSSRILPRRRSKSSHMLESLLPRIGVQLSCQTQFANSSDVMPENAFGQMARLVVKRKAMDPAVPNQQLHQLLIFGISCALRSRVRLQEHRVQPWKPCKRQGSPEWLWLNGLAKIKNAWRLPRCER